MEITIVSEKKNPLLKRREVIAEIAHSKTATPSRKEMLSSLAKILKSKEDIIVIYKIFTRKGISTCEARVMVYEKKEDIPKEQAAKQERRLKSKKKPKEAKEAPKETPKEEKPAEPKKEEKPKEAKEAPKEDKPEKK